MRGSGGMRVYACMGIRGEGRGRRYGHEVRETLRRHEAWMHGQVMKRT
jgi:hypothetical protein